VGAVFRSDQHVARRPDSGKIRPSGEGAQVRPTQGTIGTLRVEGKQGSDWAGVEPRGQRRTGE